MLNQDIHKNLRRNKSGVPLTEIEKSPSNYKRPTGFSVVPGLLAFSNQSSGKSSANNRRGSYFDNVQEEMQG